MARPATLGCRGVTERVILRGTVTRSSARFSKDAIAVAIALAVLAGAGRARAGNTDAFLVGNRAAMTAGAVTASVDDGSAAYYNPAGLGAVEQSRFDVSGAVYALRFYEATRFLGLTNGVTKDGSVSEFLAVPTEIAFVRRLDDRFTLGLGYFVPQAEDVLLSERLVDRGDDGLVSTGALDARVTDSNAWLSAALGVRASDRLRFGFALMGGYSTETQTLSFFGDVKDGETSLQALHLATLGKATRLRAALGAGMQAALPSGLTLGLWARGPELQLVSSIRSRANVVAGSNVPGVMAQLESFSNDLENEGDAMGLTSLGRYAVGVAYTIGGATVSVDFDVQPGLRNERTATDRAFTFNARAGLLFPLSADVLFGAGVFSDRATEGSRATSFADFYGGTVGIELTDVFGLAGGQSSDRIGLTSAFALRYAYGSGRSDTLLADARGTFDTLEGNGRQSIHEFGLHVGSSLKF